MFRVTRWSQLPHFQQIYPWARFSPTTRTTSAWHQQPIFRPISSMSSFIESCLILTANKLMRSDSWECRRFLTLVRSCRRHLALKILKSSAITLWKSRSTLSSMQRVFYWTMTAVETRMCSVRLCQDLRSSYWLIQPQANCRLALSIQARLASSNLSWNESFQF